MDVVENVVDGDTILDQVDPENRDIFREIFLNARVNFLFAFGIEY
jgi:hypothetical protein